MQGRREQQSYIIDQAIAEKEADRVYVRGLQIKAEELNTAVHVHVLSTLNHTRKSVQKKLYICTYA